jgi:hypothetical protein
MFISYIALILPCLSSISPAPHPLTLIASTVPSLHVRRSVHAPAVKDCVESYQANSPADLLHGTQMAPLVLDSTAAGTGGVPLNSCSIPYDVMKQIVQSKGKRLRLLSPYKEHLAQAFAYFYKRVALPNSILLNTMS